MSTGDENGHDRGGEEEEEDEPELSFSLEEDLNRKDQLFSFRKEQPTPTTKNYRPTEQQLLQEGKLGNSEFAARLRKVVFSTYEGQPACLIIFRVDFATAKKGWFRFRNATIEVEFEEAGDQSNADDDDDDDDDDYYGPLVRKFYPELIRGHVSSLAKTYGLAFEVPISPPPFGAGISASWKVTAPREGLHLVQGRLMGSPETRIKWTTNENEVSKGGIYEQPMFAVVVGHAQDQSFTMTLKIKATTYVQDTLWRLQGEKADYLLKLWSTGGLPVIGKGGSRILFKPSKARQSTGEKFPKSTSRLAGGSFEIGNQQWTSAQGNSVALRDLSEIDLESETRMRAELLSEQGPGAGRSVYPLVVGE